MTTDVTRPAVIAPDPAWNRILATDLEDEAWQEQIDRHDRAREHAPALTFTEDRPIQPARPARSRRGALTPPNAAPHLSDDPSAPAGWPPAGAPSPEDPTP